MISDQKHSKKRSRVIRTQFCSSWLRLKEKSIIITYITENLIATTPILEEKVAETVN